MMVNLSFEPLTDADIDRAWRVNATEFRYSN